MIKHKFSHIVAEYGSLGYQTGFFGPELLIHYSPVVKNKFPGLQHDVGSGPYTAWCTSDCNKLNLITIRLTFQIFDTTLIGNTYNGNLVGGWCCLDLVMNCICQVCLKATSTITVNWDALGSRSGLPSLGFPPQVFKQRPCLHWSQCMSWFSSTIRGL